MISVAPAGVRRLFCSFLLWLAPWAKFCRRYAACPIQIDAVRLPLGHRTCKKPALRKALRGYVPRPPELHRGEEQGQGTTLEPALWLLQKTGAGRYNHRVQVWKWPPSFPLML
jgi:hypothetical protein